MELLLKRQIISYQFLYWLRNSARISNTPVIRYIRYTSRFMQKNKRNMTDFQKLVKQRLKIKAQLLKRPAVIPSGPSKYIDKDSRTDFISNT